MSILCFSNTTILIFVYYSNLDNNKIKHALRIQVNTNLDNKRSSTKYNSINLASDYKSPGPADYNVHKPLHNSGRVSAVT